MAYEYAVRGRAIIMSSEMEAHVGRAISGIDHWLGTNCWAADPRSWNSRRHAIMKRKSFGELALYLYLVNQLRGECDGRLYELVSQRVLGSDEYIDLAFRTPGKALLYGTPFLALKVSGDLPAIYLDRLGGLLASKGVLGTERLPHRQLDLWHFMTALGLPAPFDGVVASRFGLLEFPPSPILCSSDDAYGLTHNVFYITNFGVETEAFPPYRFTKKAELIHCLTALSARVLFEGNVDLLLELAICLMILTGVRGPVVRIIVEHALDLLEKDSILNSPENSDVAEVGQDAPEEAHWFGSYHTMSVAAIAFRIFANADDDGVVEEGAIQEITKEALLTRGGIMLDLMNYKLLDAVSALETLDRSQVHPDVAAIDSDIMSFLADQRRSDGSYGYFSDELRIWSRRGGDVDEFRAIQSEIDSAIAATLSEESQRVSDSVD